MFFALVPLSAGHGCNISPHPFACPVIRLITRYSQLRRRGPLARNPLMSGLSSGSSCAIGSDGLLSRTFSVRLSHQILILTGTVI